MMSASYIQLPADSSGKKVATRQRTVGSDTVEEQYVIELSARVLSGVYVAHHGVTTVAASAQTFPAAAWFLINPVGSSVTVALRKLNFQSQMGSALTAPTSPRLLLVTFTFTGTASGASITPRKADTSYPTATGSLRSANTGLTITRESDIFAFLPFASQSGSSGGPSSASDSSWMPPEDERLVLAAGEGVCLTQADAGTGSDTRRWISNFCWEEYTEP